MSKLNEKETTPSEMSFEKAMQRLETIVRELEEGELPLEDAFNKFEEGMRLSKLCSAKLDETEKKVSVLLKNADGSVRKTDF